MASLWLCGSVGIPTTPAPSPSQVVIASYHPSFQFLKLRPEVSPFPFTLRVKNAVRSQTRRMSFSAFASNSNPSAGDSVQEKSNETTTRDAGQGPPFLTILAGLLVFFLISWILGSIVLWLLGLIIKLPPK